MTWREHIVVDPAVLVGKPIVKGTRISVELVLDRLADGWSHDDILAAYPQLTREQVLAAVRFASELFKQERFVAAAKVDGWCRACWSTRTFPRRPHRRCGPAALA